MRYLIIMAEELTCRICFDNEKKSKLIMPCKCNRPIHKKCLKRWMRIKRNPAYCEICKQKYNVDFIVIPNNRHRNILDEWDSLNEPNLNILLINSKFAFFLILVIFICIILLFIEIKMQIDYDNKGKNISIPESLMPTSSIP